MAQIEKFLVALFLFAMAHSIILVDATFSKSMYITWGSQHASMQGEDLQLVLDQTSGENSIYNCIQFILSQQIYLSWTIENICIYDQENNKVATCNHAAFFNTMLQLK